MEHPKVAIYRYVFCTPNVHFIRVHRELEPVVPGSETMIDFCVGCTVGRKDDLRKDVSIIFLCEQLVENTCPKYHISCGLAARLLRRMKNRSTHPMWTEEYLDRVQELAERCATEFEEYAAYRRQERAARRIQRAFLENYYNPETAFCQARLWRDLKRLQGA